MQYSSIQAKLSDTTAPEVQILGGFYRMMSIDTDKEFYGLKHVNKNNKIEIIDNLLVTSELFQPTDIVVDRISTHKISKES